MEVKGGNDGQRIPIVERKLELDGAIEVGKKILHGRVDTWKILVHMHSL